MDDMTNWEAQTLPKAIQDLTEYNTEKRLGVWG
jgi:hypothetical protein